MSISTILIDSREPLNIQGLTFGGLPVAVTALDAGDLQLDLDDGATILIERKTADDFLNTLRDGRLFGQIARMRAATPWAYLAITGILTPGPAGKCHSNYRETGWTWASVQGALLTVQELGVGVIHVGSEAEYEDAVIRLAARDRDAVRVLPPRDVLITGVPEAILAGLPGIGSDKAAALIEYCGSAASALEFLTRDNWTGPTSVRGVADGSKRRVRAALGLSDDLILAVCTRDAYETMLRPSTPNELKDEVSF